jgi:hypothetical protein
MPKLPMDYSKTIIYKIEHIDNDSLVYVGHTTCWDKRKYNHKFNCYNEKGGHYNLKLYQMIRENGGWEKFKMIEVEKYPCNDRREAERRENNVMKKFKPNMNTNRSYITKEELDELHRVCIKKYYENNKEKINSQMKEYYENNKEKAKLYRDINKEKIKEQRRAFYKENKDKIQEKRKDYVKEYYLKTRNIVKEKAKQYREKNTEKVKQYRENNKDKVLCKCGCEVTKLNFKRHLTTKKHIDLMENKI